MPSDPRPGPFEAEPAHLRLWAGGCLHPCVARALAGGAVATHRPGHEDQDGQGNHDSQHGNVAKPPGPIRFKFPIGELGVLVHRGHSTTAPATILPPQNPPPRSPHGLQPHRGRVVARRPPPLRTPKHLSRRLGASGHGPRSLGSRPTNPVPDPPGGSVRFGSRSAQATPRWPGEISPAGPGRPRRSVSRSGQRPF